MSQSIPIETAWSRGASIIGIGAIGVVAGGLIGSAAGCAFGLALIAAPLVVRWLLRFSIRRVIVTRTAATFASEGDRVPVTISIRNGGAVPVFHARVTEVFGPESLSPITIPFDKRIDRGHVTDQTYFGTCKRARGIYPHGPMLLELTDPFDWFTARRALHTTTEFKVYPKLQKASLPERLFVSLTEPDALQRVARISESDEFFAVRDYVAGDSLKRIHWALTARRDYPVVREFLPAVEQELVIFLDVSRQLRFSGARLSNFESTVRFAASLSARAVRAGFRVQLRCGSQGSFDVPPAAGRAQYLRIVETLIRVRTRTDDSFAATLSRARNKIPRAATAVVVLHPYLLGDPGFAGAVAALARRGFRVACVVYGVRPEAHSEDTPARHARYLAGLRRAGAELWTDTGVPLRTAARKAPVS